MTYIQARNTAFLCAAMFLFAPAFVSAAYSELHFKSTGEISVSNVTVMQKSGTTLFVRAQWEDTFLRLVITTNASTDIKKNYGEKATVADIDVGHFLDVEGKITGGGDSITIVASKIRDTALLREAKTFSGPIKSIDALSQSFVVTDKLLGDVTVVVAPTVTITQGKRQVAFSAFKVGSKIVSMSGTYDYATKSLAPTAIELFQAKDVFIPKNFQGTLKSVSAATLPSQLVVTIDKTDYTVFLSEKAVVLTRAKGATTLKRFTEGDTVRLYGAIRETNLSEIDAEVVRNLNF